MHDIFIKNINTEIERNQKSPIVRNFKDNYRLGKLPMYAVVELFTFGTLSKFFKNMKNEDKKCIAKSYGIGYKYLESWFESISYLRNICAHFGRIYNIKLAKTPQLYKEYKKIGIQNNKLFGALLCMKYLLKEDEQWNCFVEEIELLLDKYENVDMDAMGFMKEWKKMLYNAT